MDESACFDAFFEGLRAPWPRLEPWTGLALANRPGAPGAIVLSSTGPARAAGILAGDRLVEVNGRKVVSRGDFLDSVRRFAPGADTEPVEYGAAARSTDERSVPPAATDAQGRDAASGIAAGGPGTAKPPTPELLLVVDRQGARKELHLTPARAPVVAAPGALPVPASRIVATAGFEASVLPSGPERNAARLNLATALMSRADYRRAIDLALSRRDWADGVEGAASPAVALWLAGLCYQATDMRDKALDAFRRASADTSATFWTPDGLPVAPIARIMVRALEETGSTQETIVPGTAAPGP